MAKKIKERTSYVSVRAPRTLKQSVDKLLESFPKKSGNWQQFLIRTCEMLVMEMREDSPMAIWTHCFCCKRQLNLEDPRSKQFGRFCQGCLDDTPAPEPKKQAAKASVRDPLAALEAEMAALSAPVVVTQELTAEQQLEKDLGMF